MIRIEDLKIVVEFELLNGDIVILKRDIESDVYQQIVDMLVSLKQYVNLDRVSPHFPKVEKE